MYDPTAEVTVINASEIRLELSGADEPKVLAAPIKASDPAEASAIARGSSAAEHAAAATSRGSAKSCSTVFSVHTRSELEALKICHHMTL